MITPAYSPTATERVLPRLALDFTTGVLDPRVTVTRALNTATRVTSTGVIAVVNADLPRFDYDPATLAPKGLLIEETRTNVLICSDTFDNAIWVRTGSSIDKDMIVSPDGTQNADYLKEDSATSVHRIEQAVILGASATYTYTVYYKITDTTRKIALHHTPSNTGRVFDANGGQEAGLFNAPISFSVTAFNNGWYRASISVAAVSGGNSFRVWLVRASDNAINYAGNGTSGAYLYGADAEAGTFATSYIPTGTVTATRNADNVQMTGTNFSSWYNQSEGAFLASVELRSKSPGGEYSLRVAGGTTPIVIGYNDSATAVRPINTSVNGAQVSISAAAFKSVGAYSFTTNTARGAVNGTLSGIDSAVGTLGTNTVAYIGSFNGAAGSLNGWMKLLEYWPQKLINAELTAFSKL